jgi:nuclear GTP-binding protein
VFAKNASEVELVLRNVVKLESVEDPVAPAEAILRRCNKDQVCPACLVCVSHAQVMQRYLVPRFESTMEFLQHLARRQGRLKKGGVPDNEAAARILLQDWLDGRLSYYTMPPAEHHMPSHLSSTVVGELAKEFDIDALVDEEKGVLDGLPVKVRNTLVQCPRFNLFVIQ